MTLTGATLRVRHLINQTSSSNTLFDDTNFIANVLNQGRRMFASILPEAQIPKLRKSATWSAAAAANTFSHPSDYLKEAVDPITTITVAGSSYEARKLPKDELWRVRTIKSNNSYTSDFLDEYYYYERSDGISFLNGTITACVRDYIKVPTDLSASDNVELPEDLDDMVVDFAFQKCEGTTRGDKELAVLLMKERNTLIGARQ